MTMETIKTETCCFDALWNKREELISKFTERFGNSEVGVKYTEIRVVTKGVSYKLVFNGYAGDVPNNAKYFNKVQIKLYRRSINQRQYGEIASHDFDTKGYPLCKSQLTVMVKSAYFYVLGILYNYEVRTAAEWGENYLSKFNKEEAV